VSPKKRRLKSKEKSRSNRRCLERRESFRASRTKSKRTARKGRLRRKARPKEGEGPKGRKGINNNERKTVERKAWEEIDPWNKG